MCHRALKGTLVGCTRIVIVILGSQYFVAVKLKVKLKMKFKDYSRGAHLAFGPDSTM